MRIASQFSKVATLVVLVLLSMVFMAWAQSTYTETFEGSNSPLSGGAWSAHESLVRQTGNMHTTATVTTTKGIGVYAGVSNVNQVEIQWAAAGDGCDDPGTGFAGAVFMTTSAYTGDGYYAYYYSGQLRLWTITAGVLTAQKASYAIPSAPTMAAGSTFLVKVIPATYRFEFYLNGAKIGSTLEDLDKTYNLSSTCYGGALLYGGKANDIEQLTVAYVPPSSDSTPPAAATIAAGSPTSSSITVTWTAQADDGSTGAAASSYDLRYSTANITADNFSLAPRFTTTTPKSPGSSESYTVTGLAASTKYYFAVKIYDEAPNASALSNVASATTSAGSGGGTTPSGNWNCLGVEDFNRATLGTTDWSTTKFAIENNELAIASPSTGYGLAVFTRAGANKSAGADSIKISMNMGASSIYYQSSGFTPAGFALMLDSPSSSANGYWLRRSSNKLTLYAVTGSGTIFNTLVSEVSVTTSRSHGRPKSDSHRQTDRHRIDDPSLYR